MPGKRPRAPCLGRYRWQGVACRAAHRQHTGPGCWRAAAAKGATLLPLHQARLGDGGYNYELVTEATSIAVEIVKKNKDQISFAVLTRRWVVERFFACINRNRRLAKDSEPSIKSAAAFLYAASVMLLVRRLARYQ